MPKNNNTSWEQVAGWYDQLFEGKGTYQKELILPNLLRVMDIRRDDTVVDIACGQGFFAREFAKRSTRVIGADISRSLIDIARRNASKNIDFHVSSADSMPFVKSGSADKAVLVLALQNIQDAGGVFRECARILKRNGSFSIVLNHPAFRVLKASGWGWDEKQNVQYRRIDRYLSESKVPIQMHPGDTPDQYTLSFHRPLQFYFKLLRKAGLCVTGLEEWNSRKKSEPGPRAKAENEARKEIPLFLCLFGMKLP